MLRPPAALLTVGQLPHFEGPQLDLVDNGGVVGHGHVMRVLGGETIENFISEYAWALVLTLLQVQTTICFVQINLQSLTLFCAKHI